MPMSPYILVLARNTHEGAIYVRRANLPRGRWRNVASASSIRGIRQAHVHVLPGFMARPDRHAILAVLRHAKCEFFDVEMPELAPVDQGDGMGEQLSFEDVIATALVEEVASNTLETEDAERAHVEALEAEYLAAFEAGVGAREEPEPEEVTVTAEQLDAAAAAVVEDAPKQRRRTRCGQCGELHFKDEPCAEDMVAPINKKPAVDPTAMFN